MNKNIFFVICAIIYTSSLFAQTNKTIDTQYNGWYMYFGNHRINSNIGIHSEYQWRRSNIIQEWQQSLLRFGVDWYLDKNLILTAGYGWIYSFPYGKQPIATGFNEHRIWQQCILNQNIKRLYFQHRFRLEQRFLENKILNTKGEFESDGYRYRNRARYRLFIAVPLTKKKMEDNTLFLALYDEVFLGFGEGIAKNILDQNRLYCALGWRFNSQFNVQLGYLNHYVIKGDGNSHERNHTLQVGLQYNLDFRREEG